MKRGLLFLLVLMLAFGAAGCVNEPVESSEPHTSDVSSVQSEALEPSAPTEPAGLAALKKEIADQGKLMGIAYLGWFENDAEWAKEELFKQEYMKDIPFVKDFAQYAEYEGYRMYAILPADDSVTVSVCKCEFDDEYMPYDGEELIRTREPFLIRGNMSDTIPNLYVIAKKGSQKVEYALAQSGEDGKLENSEDNFVDFTPYSSMPEFDHGDDTDTEKVGTDPSLLEGEWKMVSGETDGYQFTAEEEGIDSEITIDVDLDSTATYSCSTEFKRDRFEAVLEYMDEPVYEGCGNDVWKVKMLMQSGSFNDEHEFYATLTDENTLLLQHFFPFDGALGVSYQTYRRK